MKLTLEKQLASGEIALARTSSEKEFLVQGRLHDPGGENQARPSHPRHSLQPVAATVSRQTRPKFGSPKTAGGNGGRGRNPRRRAGTGESNSRGRRKILGGMNNPVFKTRHPKRGCPWARNRVKPMKEAAVVAISDRSCRQKRREPAGANSMAHPEPQPTVKKNGYAISRSPIRSGLLVNGLSVTFMHIKTAKLDPTPIYGTMDRRQDRR